MPAVRFGIPSEHRRRCGPVGARRSRPVRCLEPRFDRRRLLSIARADDVYDHCDLDALAAALRHAGGRPALIVTDAVFSMDGDLAPLEGIVELARRIAPGCSSTKPMRPASSVPQVAAWWLRSASNGRST